MDMTNIYSGWKSAEAVNGIDVERGGRLLVQKRGTLRKRSI